MAFLKKSILCAFALCALSLFMPFTAQAEEKAFLLTLKGHQFAPAELTVPAGQKVKITVKNLDPTPIEFESFELNREKVVAPQSEVVIFIGPLEPGVYQYFDDFHPKESKGVIKAQ